MKILKKMDFSLYDLNKFGLNKTNRKNHILFEEERHLYINELTNEYYTSVTRLLDNFSKKFVPNEWNTKSTMKDLNMTYEQVLDYWKEVNKFSQIKGSYVHYAIECMLKNDYTVQQMTDLYNLDKETVNYLKFVKKLKLKDFIVEDLLYSDEYKIAGQSDIVKINKTTIDIIDWKTNDDELKREGYNNQKLLYPLNDVESGKLTKYELQLSVYIYFAEKIYNKKAGKMYICHFRNGKCKKIKLNYRKKEVLTMLDYVSKN